MITEDKSFKDYMTFTGDIFGYVDNLKKFYTKYNSVALDSYVVYLHANGKSLQDICFELTKLILSDDQLSEKLVRTNKLRWIDSSILLNALIKRDKFDDLQEPIAFFGDPEKVQELLGTKYTKYLDYIKYVDSQPAYHTSVADTANQIVTNIIPTLAKDEYHEIDVGNCDVEDIIEAIEGKHSFIAQVKYDQSRYISNEESKPSSKVEGEAQFKKTLILRPKDMSSGELNGSVGYHMVNENDEHSQQ